MVGLDAQQKDLRHDLGVWLRGLHAENVVCVDEGALAKQYLDALIEIEYDGASYRGTPYRVSHAQLSTNFMRCGKGDLGFYIYAIISLKVLNRRVKRFEDGFIGMFCSARLARQKSACSLYHEFLRS